MALSIGKPIALAPLVWSHLVRGIYDYVQSDFTKSASGPLWLLQLCLLAYFPEFRPTVAADVYAPIFALKLVNVPPKPHSFQECFSFFYDRCVSRSSLQFLPFASKKDCAPFLALPTNPSDIGPGA